MDSIDHFTSFSLDSQPPEKIKSNWFLYGILGCILIGILWKFKDNILSFFNNIFKTSTENNNTDSKDENQTTSESEPVTHSKPQTENNSENSNNTNKEIENALNQPPQNNFDEYQPDDSSSSIQNNSKTGYCFIGEDRGFRSCAYVGANDTCMSQQIYPRLDICQNPSLRE